MKHIFGTAFHSKGESSRLRIITMKKAITSGLVCIILLSAFMTGCQEKPAPADHTNDNEYLTFDNYGRQVIISQKPQKVLTLGPHLTELFVALGLSDHIIGNSLNNHSRGALPEYAEEYAKIPELTYSSATREAVITSGADFIYGVDWEFGSQGLNPDELADLGIITYMNSASTLDEIFQEIQDIGQIFGIEETAAAFIEDQQERLSTVERKITDQNEVNVLVYDSGGDGVFTAGGSNFETLLIELAGGKNIFDEISQQEWTTVSYEEVLKRNPDVILVHDYDAPSLEQKISDILNDPALSQLEAVRSERFVSISLESVLPGNRMAYTVETLAAGFYPELFE